MKLLVILIYFTEFSFATEQQCNYLLPDFLNCVAASTTDKTKGKLLEQEFYNDFVKLTNKCFDNVQTQSQTKCILSQSDLTIDIYSADGPLHDCGDSCIKPAVFLRDKFFKTDPAVQKCFRTKLSAALLDDILPCVQGSLGDFTLSVPPLPDFDENVNDYMEIVDKNINARVMALNRLDVCTVRNPDRAQKSSECISKTLPHMYKQNCKLLNQCHNKTVSENCSEHFYLMQNSFCNCLASKQKEWHSKLETIQDALLNAGSSDCAGKIRQVLGTWPRKLQDAIRSCLPTGEFSKLNMEKMIDLGCIQSEGASDNTNNVRKFQIGFRFVRNLLDAINERSTRFCFNNC